MCFPIWKLFSYKRLDYPLECSCDMCGKNFSNTENLVTHMGYHETSDMNRVLSHGYGTVRCNKCWTSFVNVEALIDHPCAQNAPAVLETIVIYDD